jgi:hypothetical protein
MVRHGVLVAWAGRSRRRRDQSMRGVGTRQQTFSSRFLSPTGALQLSLQLGLPAHRLLAAILGPLAPSVPPAAAPPAPGARRGGALGTHPAFRSTLLRWLMFNADDVMGDLMGGIAAGLSGTGGADGAGEARRARARGRGARSVVPASDPGAAATPAQLIAAPPLRPTSPQPPRAPRSTCCWPPARAWRAPRRRAAARTTSARRASSRRSWRACRRCSRCWTSAGVSWSQLAAATAARSLPAPVRLLHLAELHPTPSPAPRSPGGGGAADARPALAQLLAALFALDARAALAGGGGGGGGGRAFCAAAYKELLASGGAAGGALQTQAMEVGRSAEGASTCTTVCQAPPMGGCVERPRGSQSIGPLTEDSSPSPLPAQMLPAVACALPPAALKSAGIEAALADVVAGWDTEGPGDRTSPAAVRYSRQLAALLAAAAAAARAAALPALPPPAPAPTAPHASPTRRVPPLLFGLASPGGAAAGARGAAEAAKDAEGACLLLVELLFQELLKLGRGLLAASGGSGGSSAGGAGGAGRGPHPFGDMLEARLALLAAAAWRGERRDKHGGTGASGATAGGAAAMDVDGAGLAVAGAAEERGLGWRLLALCWEHLFDKPVQEEVRAALLGALATPLLELAPPAPRASWFRNHLGPLAAAAKAAAPVGAEAGVERGVLSRKWAAYR